MGLGLFTRFRVLDCVGGELDGVVIWFRDNRLILFVGLWRGMSFVWVV